MHNNINITLRDFSGINPVKQGSWDLIDELGVWVICCNG